MLYHVKSWTNKTDKISLATFEISENFPLKLATNHSLVNHKNDIDLESHMGFNRCLQPKLPATVY